MILGPTIEHLRANCPLLAGRVAGAADFRLGLQNYNENMPLPAAYVVPLNQQTEPGLYGGNQNMTGLFQIIEKVVGVVVEFDARPDRRGQAPAMNYDAIEASLFAALLVWSPILCRVPNKSGFTFDSGEFLDLDRARLFYQWRFLLRFQIDGTDGWQQPDEGEDLLGINLIGYKKDGAGPIDEQTDTPAFEAHIITSAAKGVSDEG